MVALLTALGVANPSPNGVWERSGPGCDITLPDYLQDLSQRRKMCCKKALCCIFYLLQSFADFDPGVKALKLLFCLPNTLTLTL
jgi:hypothetical protein